MRVYISGPITGTEDYIERFAKAKAALQADGNSVINPAALGEVLPADATHAEYMELCLPLVKMADAIFMMNGYEKSKGARMELECAIANKKTVRFE